MVGREPGAPVARRRVRAGGCRALVPPLHGARRRGRRQVQARPGGAFADRRPRACARRDLPALRRGDHLLARAGGGQAGEPGSSTATHLRTRWPRSGRRSETTSPQRSPRSAWRPLSASKRRATPRSRASGASAAGRGARTRASDGRGLRRRQLGRAAIPGAHRAPRGLGAGRPAHRRLHGQARICSSCDRAGVEASETPHRSSWSRSPRTSRASCSRTCSTSTWPGRHGPDPALGRGQPALRRGDGVDADRRRLPRRARERRGRPRGATGSPFDPGAARVATRSVERRRAACDRAGGGGGKRLPLRRRRGAFIRRPARAGARVPGIARPQGADRAVPGVVRRRRRLPLPPRAHPRSGLRGRAEADSRRPPRTLRGVARGGGGRPPPGARRSARLSPRAGVPAAARGVAARRQRAGPGCPRRRPARRCRPASAGPRRRAGRGQSARSSCVDPARGGANRVSTRARHRSRRRGRARPRRTGAVRSARPGGPPR